MSYDIYIHDPNLSDDEIYSVCSDDPRLRTNPASKGAYFNYTYNLSRFFSFIRCNPMHELDGLTAGEVADRITSGLRSIQDRDIDDLGLQYDPLVDPYTGETWGSVRGALILLWNIRAYCQAHPDYLFEEHS